MNKTKNQGVNENEIKMHKKLASELNKVCDYTINCVKMNDRQYGWYVDTDIYDHYNDYDYKTQKFSVICVEYPSEYYACNRYITSNDLHRLYNKLTQKDWNSFVKLFEQEIEI